MATDRQKLIHLHGSARLTNPAKLNTGEIAVTHAADNKEVELAVLNNGGGLVYIPSRDYIDTAIAGVQSIANEAATKSELTAATQTLEGEINDKVAQTEYNEYTAATNTSISGLSGRVDGVESTASSALAKANSAVQKADADGTVASVGDTKVKVTVTQTEGKITAVSVVEDFSSLATAAALSAVETKANGAVQDVAISGLTGVSKSESDSVVTFDFSKITINCGTYDEE